MAIVTLFKDINVTARFCEICCMCHREILQRMMCKWGFENSAVKQNKFTVHERAF